MTAPVMRSSFAAGLGYTLIKGMDVCTSSTPTPDAATLTRNALVRCQVHPAGTERDMCERMVRGEGRVQGDVASGGVLRELTVTVPAPTPVDAAR